MTLDHIKRVAQYYNNFLSDDDYNSECNNDALTDHQKIMHINSKIVESVENELGYRCYSRCWDLWLFTLSYCNCQLGRQY